MSKYEYTYTESGPVRTKDGVKDEKFAGPVRDDMKKYRFDPARVTIAKDEGRSMVVYRQKSIGFCYFEDLDVWSADQK
jgi:hypothetical protein